MTDLSIPNVFVAGSTAIAADVNANFDAVKALVNTTGVPKIQDGAVDTAARMGAGIVTAAKLGLAIPFTSLLTNTGSAGTGTTGAICTSTGTVAVASNNTVYVDTTVASSRVVAKASGLFLVIAEFHVTGNSGSSQQIGCGLVKNGTGGQLSAPKGFVIIPDSSSGTAYSTAIGFLSLAANDYLQVGAQTILGTNSVSATLSMAYLGAVS